MQINPSSRNNLIERTVSRSSVKATGQTAAAAREIQLENANAVSGLLAQTPDVRMAAVERARALVADTKYPPDVVLNGVARLLAAELNPEE
jgi:hypothetical protein